MKKTKTRRGLLEGINIRLSKGDGDSLKKSVDAAKSILGSIGSVSSDTNPTK